jgi:hypothetical protein
MHTWYLCYNICGTLRGTYTRYIYITTHKTSRSIFQESPALIREVYTHVISILQHTEHQGQSCESLKPKQVITRRWRWLFFTKNKRNEGDNAKRNGNMHHIYICVYTYICMYNGVDFFSLQKINEMKEIMQKEMVICIHIHLHIHTCYEMVTCMHTYTYM